MDNQIQIHCFLPIHIRIADWQLTWILSIHIHVGFVFGHVSWRTLHMFLSHKEQQVVRVDILIGLRLKQEMADKQIRPIGGALQHHKPTICNEENTNVSIKTVNWMSHFGWWIWFMVWATKCAAWCVSARLLLFAVSAWIEFKYYWYEYDYWSPPGRAISSSEHDGKDN